VPGGIVTFCLFSPFGPVAGGAFPDPTSDEVFFAVEDSAGEVIFDQNTNTDDNSIIAPPALNITLDTSGVVVSWPSSPTNYVLQSALSLDSSWADLNQTPADDGTNKSLTISPLLDSTFFRLRQKN
jgi:hypothetical protein